MQSDHRCTAFSLVELLAVIAIIALLLSLLMPAMHRGRALAKESVCASQLKQTGLAMGSYLVEYREWIPGSPNTTGWGSFAHTTTPGIPDTGGVYKSKWEIPQQERRPVTHVYDWATPLRRLMMRRSESIKQKQPETRVGLFQCPATPAEQAYSDFTGGDQEIPSYLTCVYFLCSIPGGGGHRAFGYEARNGFDYLPMYRPRMDLVGPPARKVYLADGTRMREVMEFDHATNGYADYGAWRNRGNTLEAYRDEHLMPWTYRHPGGINALFFDGHVEALSEQQSREPVYWFPSKTDTAKLPAKLKAEECLIVP